MSLFLGGGETKAVHVSILLSVLPPGTILVSIIRKAVLVNGACQNTFIHVYSKKKEERVGKEIIYNRVGG